MHSEHSQVDYQIIGNIERVRVLVNHRQLVNHFCIPISNA